MNQTEAGVAAEEGEVEVALFVSVVAGDVAGEHAGVGR